MPSIIQHSLFNDNSNDTRPLPLVIADKWGFPLQYHVEGDEYWYSVQDWIGGLLAGDVAQLKKTIADLSGYFESNLRKMKRMNERGQKRDGNFAQDETLYMMSTRLRQTEEREALKAIINYLAKAGAIADDMRLNPENHLPAIASAVQEKYPDGDHATARLQSTVTRKELTAVIKEKVFKPHYGAITDAEYVGAFSRKAQELRAQNGDLAVRDAMHPSALAIITSIEFALRQYLGDRDQVSNNEAIEIAKILGAKFRPVVIDLSKTLGIDIATNQRLLQ